MKKMKYTQLLDIKYQLHSALRKAKSEWDGYVKYGTDSILYTITHGEVKALRRSIKDLDQVMSIMGDNKLFSYESDL